MQISRAGRWDTSSVANAYLTGLPRKFLRTVAGFSSQGAYFLRRAAFCPSLLLQQQLWPWVEPWEERFRRRAEKKRWKDGGLDEDDMAGEGFIKLMKYLRVVLLQDLAVLQPRKSLFLPFEYLLTIYFYIQVFLGCRSSRRLSFRIQNGTPSPLPFVSMTIMTMRQRVIY